MQPYELGEFELRHLVALQAIARSGTFWGAAEALGCSQSALSQQIATVERVLGCPLVDRRRGKRSVSITEAGGLLLKHAEAIVARLRAVHADFTAFAEGEAGTLRVGTFESSGTRLLPALLREFRETWPKVELRLTELAKDDALLRLVEQGELDLSFAVLPLPDGPFAHEVLRRDPFVLVVPRKSHLARRRRGRVTLEEVRGLDLVGFGQGRSMEQAEAQIRSRGVAPRIVFRSNYNGMVQGLVAAGLGAAIAPRLTLDARDPDTVIVGEVDFVAPRLIALAWHQDRYRSPAAEAFVATARRAAASLDRAPATMPRGAKPGGR
jgi:DNA-binding transcriptional LysR family regulator